MKQNADSLSWTPERQDSLPPSSRLPASWQAMVHLSPIEDRPSQEDCWFNRLRSRSPPHARDFFAGRVNEAATADHQREPRHELSNAVPMPLHMCTRSSLNYQQQPEDLVRARPPGRPTPVTPDSLDLDGIFDWLKVDPREMMHVSVIVSLLGGVQAMNDPGTVPKKACTEGTGFLIVMSPFHTSRHSHASSLHQNM